MDVALALIIRAYGKPPHRMYFQGNSQGGMRALIVVQRWPQDYDGVIAIHPVYDLVALQTADVLLGQALYNVRAPGFRRQGGDGLQGCARYMRRAGGLKDGVIGNISACDKAFDVASLRCRDGADGGADCLSDAQIQTIRIFTAPMKLGVTLSGGVDTFGKWPVLEGASMAWRFNPFGLTPDKATVPPQSNASIIYILGDQLIRFMIMADPHADSLSFDPTAHRDALQALSRQMDASDPDISAFRKRGGKLLLLHGTSDSGVHTAQHHRLLRKAQGRISARRLPSFARFYLVPRLRPWRRRLHHGLGFDCDAGCLVAKGVAPGLQTVTDTAKETAGRTRPLCEYPAYPKYKGAGDATHGRQLRLRQALMAGSTVCADSLI